MSYEFLIHDQPAKITTSFIVGNAIVKAPAFIPEIKGDEDLRALLRCASTLPQGHPIMVPSRRWMQLISNPIIGTKASLSGLTPINKFIEQHPIYFLDPPEFFRYTLRGELVNYAMRGERVSEFYGYLKKGEIDKAIAMAPLFFQPFIKRQLKSICSSKKISYEESIKSPPHVERAWLDDETSEGYFPYIYDVAVEAIKMPSAILIPPVPPLTKDSENTSISRIKSSNRVASYVCKDISEKFEPLLGKETRSLYPYFHLYVDWTIADDQEGLGIETIKQILDSELISAKDTDKGFAGVALTISRYHEAADRRSLAKIEGLVNEVVNICHQHMLPVILPRSGYYGLSLTDLEIQGFGILLNGNSRYTPKGGRPNPEDLYGKTPIIDKCCDFKINEVMELIRKNKEFPKIPGLNGRPTKEDFDNPALYRERWAKRMRILVHLEETRRLRESKLKGIGSPARRYLERSEHPHLSILH